MSLKYPYIDVAVNVAEGVRPATMFLTDGAPAVELPALSGIASHFVSLTDGYLIWPAGDKRAYTYFVLDGVEGTAVLTVTLLVEGDVLLSGRPIVNLLVAIKNRALGGETLTSDSIDRLIGEAGFSDEPLRNECDIWVTSGNGGVCCRTYASTGELANILGFPRQKDYERFRGVVVVPASVMMVAGEELPQITTPVDKSLMVVCPDDVAASAQRVSFSDHLKVTYSCKGFDPVAVMFEVGTTNRYVRINGPALIVNSAKHAGIVFRRRVPYSVVTIGGIPVDTYTILINGRTASRTEEGFEVSNTDFEDGTVKITVSSTNFTTYSQTFTSESLEESMPLAIVLEPESKDILLRLDFGGGRVVEERLNIEKNTPEYNQLRAGRFHGFRAHRLMGSTPETYNIDVKPTYDATPTAKARVEEATLPLEAAEATDPAGTVVTEIPKAKVVFSGEITPGPEAPTFEKAPTAIWEEKKHERKAPEFTNETIGEKEDKPKREYDYKKIGRIAGCVIVGIIVIWAISKLVSGCGGDGDVADSLDVTADSIAIVDSATATIQPGAQASAVLTAEEKEDVAYLNDNKVWKKESLKSEKYRTLFESMAAGEVDDIASNDYFAVNGQATNSEAVKAMDMMWNAKGTPQERSHRRLLKELTAKGSLDIHRLYEDLARRMPKAEDYNRSARPRR